MIIHNIISPYKTLLFNALFEQYKALKVIYLAETEDIREWKVEKSELRFPYLIVCIGSIDLINPTKTSMQLWKILREEDPDLLVIGGYARLEYWSALLWAKLNGRKTLVMNESHYDDKCRRWYKEQIKSLFVSNCDGALVDGTKHKEYAHMLGLPKEKIFIKKGVGPIDVEDWHARVEKERAKVWHYGISDPRDANFLFVGRFVREKNLFTLLEAFKRLGRDCGWNLILVGSGPLKPEIEGFVAKEGLKNLIMPGFKQREELPFWYARARVLVLPSISEPWGYVVNEAMAAGLPVLVSRRCGCYPDIVKEGVNGFGFDPENTEELYMRMENVVAGKYDLAAMGEASLTIIGEYIPQKVAHAVLDAMNRFLKTHESATSDS